MKEEKQKLAVEIGGTFTDMIYFRQDGEGNTMLRTQKVASTPSAPQDAVIAGADKLVSDWAGLAELLHGSTVATNAVLERKGVSAAMLTTEGFADILEIQRGDKENIYDLFYRRTLPIIPRHCVYPVNERTTTDGKVLVPLNFDEIRAIAAKLREKQIKAVGICFLHSYAFSGHERLAKRILEEELPDVIITASYEILPQFREYERASTLAITSYIAPVMIRYIEKLHSDMVERGFGGEVLITQSNGGIIPMEALRNEVARTLLSGPAAGVTGAIFMARQLGIENIITLDIGGTSADLCLVNNGAPLITTENKIDSLAIAVPMLDIVTVGAGGGSIAWLDEGGMLRVGPQSAGANPGPACYGRGGKSATLTDALVHRGLVRPAHFAGGNYPLTPEASLEVLDELAGKLKTNTDDMAQAICRIVEANTMQAVRLVSSERGYDARRYTLVAFGGAAALHAANIAKELGMTAVLVPCYAGILSSFGLLVADIVRDYVQTNIGRCSAINGAMLRACFSELENRATQDMVSYGFDRQQIGYRYAVDARYLGQAFELQVDLDDIPANGSEIAEAFHKLHQTRYGSSSPGNPVEIVNYRLKTFIPQNNSLLGNISYNVQTNKEEFEVNKLLVDGEWIDCRFFDWARLKADAEICGPAVVEDTTSTCYVPAGWRAKLQKNGSLLLNWEGEANG